MTKRHLVWFRHDLRLRDNPALSAACQDTEAEVIALWCITPEQWQQHNVAARQLKYQYDSLQILQQDLHERQIPLLIINSQDYASLHDELVDFCVSQQIDQLFYNYQYEFNEQQRDKQIEQGLQKEGIICQGFDDSTLCAPGTVLTGKQAMYQVFTPFSRAVLKKLANSDVDCLPLPAKRQHAATLKASKIRKFYPKNSDYDEQRFPVGHQAALEHLRKFSQQAIQNYDTSRDLPAEDNTSRLSAALAIGLLSARQCLKRILTDHPQALNEKGAAATWINELIWRDFYRHMLVAEPKLSKYQPFQAWTDHITWRKSEEQLNAWQQGNTGFPIVDAGMRQLNQTGWMHNRLRMICASFLVKDLLIDWRQGERYFSQQLIDGDLASNNGGWQWAASTGTDAAPYFRIFNPTRQGERFDPQGQFIRQWLPELDDVPTAEIHQPWVWADKQQVELKYGRPIVDHGKARADTLHAFDAARKQRK